MLRYAEHLNGHKFVAIDIATTGNMPCFHDLVEIAAVALKPSGQIDKTIMPFQQRMQAKRKNGNYLEYAKEVDAHAANWAFERWFEKLGLKPGKGIIPVAASWQNQIPFLFDWFGNATDGTSFYYDFFHPKQARDLCTITSYWNDLGASNNEYFPFPKDYLPNYVRRFGLDWRKPETPLTRALSTAEVFEKLLDTRLNAGIQLRLDFPAQQYYDQDDPDDEE